MNRSAGLALAIALALGLPGCAPAAHPGSLAVTLSMASVGGLPIAVQNDIPVPTFDRQERRQIDLSGRWRAQRVRLSNDLSLTHRDRALDGIVEEADGREQPAYDDSGWVALQVPGALNSPPDGQEIGGWYRRDFYVSATWRSLATTLKIGSANYIADVWVNGQYLGYHEGGYTPFAFDLTSVLRPGRRNSIAIRVDNPPWGTRNDIVPWGLADWWNYGGLTGPIWIEATPLTHIVRADVVPHLDGIDVAVVVRRAAAAGDSEGSSLTPTASPSATADSTVAGPALQAPTLEPSVRVEVFSAEVGPDNLESPQASALVPPGARPEVADALPLPELEPGGVARVDTGFLLGGVDRWTPAHPALYVLRISIDDGPDGSDELWTTFGLRHVSVDASTGQLLLNGAPMMFTGVGLHDEVIDPSGDGERASAGRNTSLAGLRLQLEHARQVNADMIRTGHTPANPLLLMLADRLGFAIWEEIPLYHYTPLTYGIAMDRGIPQQMLREMALRDMNRPSVLFHGLSNESTGTDERESALRTLADIDREMDGTRLTGQAAYGSMPDDPTHGPLDVAGFTFYYDVFYGADAAADTAAALGVARGTNPGKPLMALEFGRWADGAEGPDRQARVLAETYPQLEGLSAERGGVVGAAVWWTLEDFTTMVPGIAVEHFGLYTPSGEARPAAAEAARLFTAQSGEGDQQQIASDVSRAEVMRGTTAVDLRLVGYLAYGLGFSLAALGAAVLALLRRGGRAAPAVRQNRGSA